ncbi:MAG: AAA family ATPase [Leptothrix ochracea]|uniref:AAA family ATPase n=1 Tax=Leptothrix ochracea TaxID=735331 RepID=UPI0034E26F78
MSLLHAPAHPRPLTLHRFVPAFARSHVQRVPALAPSWDGTQSGVVLIADLAGFTALTEEKARRGQAGIEAMQTILNGCFEHLVSIIQAGGGEVYKFAGDATIAWWPARKGHDPQSLRDLMLAATTTAQRLQDLVPDLAAILHVPLSLRIGIGAGPVFTAIVGGVGDRWEAVLGGEALQQVATIHHLPPGQVVLSPQAWRLIHTDSHGDIRTDGSVLLHHFTHPLGPLSQALKHTLAPAPEPATQALTPFIPRHVVQRLHTESLESLAEMRSVTVLFAIMSPPSHLKALQRCTEAVQRSVYASGGSILQCLVDDKAAFVMIAAWGIPGSSYADDAERALRSAHGLSSVLSHQGDEAAIGVASGRVFAGLRGSPSRAEFALIGSVINMAARLAHHTAQTSHGMLNSGVFCDEATARAVPSIGFAMHTDTALKGLGKVTVFESLGQRVSVGLHTGAHTRVMLGREEELAQLLHVLQAITDEPELSRAVLIEGVAGIGKSHLCHAFAQAVHARGGMLAMGASDPLDHASAYRPLRSIFNTLLGFSSDTGPAQRYERVRALLEEPEHQARISLLSTFLDLDLLPSNLEEQMSGRGRIEAMTELLIQLLNATDTGVIRVVIVEDLNWLDSASWGVLEAAVHRCSGLLLIFSARHLLADDPHAALFSGAHPEQTLRISLAPLGEIAVRSIIAAELNIAVVPEVVLRAVADKTQGLPLFVHEVVATLVDRGIVKSSAGVLSFDRQALADFTIPNTIQGTVVSRIDCLNPHQQSLLKAASVVGNSFSLAALWVIVTAQKTAHDTHDASPIEQNDLNVLVQSGLIERTREPTQFQFSHALVREAVYSLLPFKHRRTLHAALGAWYEQHANNDAVMLARIANHWAQAHDPVRALHALEQAGNHALRCGAYREAQELFHRLIMLTRQGFGEGSDHPIAAEPQSLSRWHMHVGMSSYNLGELQTARDELETTAHLLGYTLPSSRRIGIVLGLEMARTLLRSWYPHRRRQAPSEELQQALHASAVLGTLGRIYHLIQEPFYTMYTIVRRLNVLESYANDTSERLEALGGMMYLSTVIGHHSLAERYANRCLSADDIRRQHPLAHAEAMVPLSLAYLVQARWELCERTGNEAAQTFQQLGERQSRMVMISILANAAELQGDFECSAQLYTLVRRLAEEVGDQLGQCWSAGGLAMLAIRQGRYEEGIEWARRGVTLAQASGEAVSYLADTGLLAMSLFEAGQVPAARALVDEGISLLAALPHTPTAHHVMNGLDTFSELILRFWELDAPSRGSPSWRRWARHAAMATTRMSGFAKVFTIGSPMAVQRQAMQHWLHGRHAKAIKAWKHAITEGERMRIPFETAKAHFELARHLPPSDPEHHHHTLQALTLFQSIGAYGLAERARSLASA